jgi:hypothetical protein
MARMQAMRKGRRDLSGDRRRHWPWAEVGHADPVADGGSVVINSRSATACGLTHELQQSLWPCPDGRRRQKVILIAHYAKLSWAPAKQVSSWTSRLNSRTRMRIPIILAVAADFPDYNPYDPTNYAQNQTGRGGGGH